MYNAPDIIHNHCRRTQHQRIIFGSNCPNAFPVESITLEAPPVIESITSTDPSEIEPNKLPKVSPIAPITEAVPCEIPLNTPPSSWMTPAETLP